MRKETEQMRITRMTPEQLRRHQNYVKRRNRAYWAWFHESQVDAIADQWNCSYTEALELYRQRWRALRGLRN